MNNVEVEALRGLLGFSVPEAAAVIGRVAEQAWRRWEAGTRAVPDDVIARILALVEWRQKVINSALSTIADAIAECGEPERVTLVWHETIDSWMTATDAEPHMFRPHRSAAAAIKAAHPDLVVLVPFNGPAYRRWLDTRPDTVSMRAAWAASV